MRYACSSYLKHLFVVCIAMLTVLDVDGAKKKKKNRFSDKEWQSAIKDDFSYQNYLFKQIGPQSPGYKRLEKEAFRKDALILPADKTPVDVILRRTQALAKHLSQMENPPSLTSENAQLAALMTQNNSSLTEEQQRSLFDKVKKLRRKIAFKNPLLDFDKLLFIKHDKMGQGEKHMVDQYLGFNQKKGGGVYVLEKPFSENPTAKSLLADSKVQNGRLSGEVLEDNGSFISLELDYDVQQIYFAFTQADNSKYQPEKGESLPLRQNR